MKKKLLLIFIALLFLPSIAKAQGYPLGWNSWNLIKTLISDSLSAGTAIADSARVTAFADSAEFFMLESDRVITGQWTFLDTVQDLTKLDSLIVAGVAGVGRAAASNEVFVIRGEFGDIATFDKDSLITFYKNLIVNGVVTVTDTLRAQAEILLDDGSNEAFTIDQYSTNTALSVQGQTSGAASQIWLFSKDGDGTDAVQIALFGLGTPGNIDNFERFVLQNQAGISFDIYTQSLGTGDLLPIIIYTTGNANQVYWEIDGSVGIGTSTGSGGVGDLNIGDSLHTAGSVVLADGALSITEGDSLVTMSKNLTVVGDLDVHGSITSEISGYFHGELSTTDSAATNISTGGTYQHMSNAFSLVEAGEVTLQTDSLIVALTGTVTDTVLMQWIFDGEVSSAGANNKATFQLFVNGVGKGVPGTFSTQLKTANAELPVGGNGQIRVVNGDLIYILVTDENSSILGIESVHWSFFELRRIHVN